MPKIFLDSKWVKATENEKDKVLRLPVESTKQIGQLLANAIESGDKMEVPFAGNIFGVYQGCCVQKVYREGHVELIYDHKDIQA